MKRPSTHNAKLEEEMSDCLSTSAPNSSNAYLDDNSPTYGNNNQLSDSDTYSDSSKKNRRKRNTYSKISDDIRVRLLEDVQNGETLKSAAKRYKINYSSAKSILHTYRKEGRILKKSAQERTIKKKVSIDEIETPTKSVKTTKKVKTERNSATSKGNQASPSTVENHKSETTSNMYTEEHNSISSPNGSHDTYLNTMKVEQQDAHKNIMKPEEKTMKDVLGSMGTGYFTGMMGHHVEDNAHVHRPKLFDNHHHNFPEYNLSELRGDYMFTEGPEYSNFMSLPHEFESFNNIVAAWHNKSSQPDNFFQDHNSFFATHHGEEKVGTENYHESFTGFRKGSMDFF